MLLSVSGRLSGSLKDCTGNQYPCLEPFQILNGKGQFHRFSGKYGIKEEEESEYKCCIEQDGSLVKLWRNCFPEIAEAITDHQYQEKNTGKIMIDKGQSGDEEPGKILGKIGDDEEKCPSVSFSDHKIDHVEKGRQTDPPDKGIAKGRDSFPIAVFQYA